MKVTLQKDYKATLTMAELEAARKVISQEKQDDETVAGYAVYAVTEALKDNKDFDYCEKVLEATAETCLNWRADDLFFEGSGKMDVLINATAKTRLGFIVITAYLSDIWQSGSRDYKNNMYVEYFKKA